MGKITNAFCLVPRSQSETGNAFREAPPQDLRQSRNETHFQPEAGNEVLKGFWLKLTPMAFRPTPQDG
ncbi:hypothetical protein [Nostoc sp. JL33]|uniref:hypothetical protein n=1 Tax=Nostoc sp. JL33 TaxID=2815396 RepID=UPI0025D1F5DD|nr:hypothetical protein [Nostoc sp. JL33]MBN3871746.1 hypothetical protein [Nostoc sp. JL33]